MQRRKIYGTSNPVFTGTLTGVAAGDGITASYSSTIDNSHVWWMFLRIQRKQRMPALADPNNKLSNYGDSTKAALTIIPAPLTVTANAASKIYAAHRQLCFTGTLTGVG